MEENSPYKWQTSTIAVHGPASVRNPHPYHSLTTPLIQTATYTFNNTADLCEFMETKLWSGGMSGRGEYGRYGNPAVHILENRLAALEGGEAALLFPTGMAAVTNTLLSILRAGTHVIFNDGCYRQTRNFCQKFLGRFGIETTQVPMGDYDALEAALQPNTRLIMSESPANPYLRVADLNRISAIAKKQSGIKTIIDATFATPVNLRPIEWGIDLVIHSATKYLSGHNDIMAGVVIGNAELINALRRNQGMLGGVLDPHAAFLLERGSKTLGLRIERQNKSAQAIAEFLENHPAVERVWYPGLPSHPDHHIACSQMKGFGGVVSFEVAVRPGQDPLSIAGRFIDALRIPIIAPSLGGVETLVEQPAFMSYYELSREERQEIGISDNLVRLSVGIEETDDLLQDLGQALEQLDVRLIRAPLAAPAADHNASRTESPR